MAEQLKQSNEDDDLLSPAGFEGNPSIRSEEHFMHDLSTTPIAVIDEKIQLFISILNDPNTLPHHRRSFAHILDYYAFETTYREAHGIEF